MDDHLNIEVKAGRKGMSRFVERSCMRSEYRET